MLVKSSSAAVSQSPYRVVDTLGPRLAVHGISRIERATSLFVSGFSLIVTLALLVPVLAGGRDMVLAAPGALLFGWLSLSSIRKFSRARRTELRLHEEGFVFLNGVEQFSVRWDEVTGVWAELWEPIRAPMPALVVRIGLANGRVFELPRGLEGAHEVAELIRRYTERQLEAEAEADLLRGKTISFGAVSLDARSFWVGKVRLTWSDVDAVRLSFRWLEIRLADGKHMLYPTDQVRNLGVLLNVAARRVRCRGAERSSALL